MSDETYDLPEELFGIGRLIKQHLSGDIADDEKKRLDDWIAQSGDNKEFFEQLINEQHLVKKLEHFYEVAAMEEVAKEELNAVLFPFAVKKSRFRKMYISAAVAAAVLLLLVLGITFWQVKKVKTVEGGLASQEIRFKNDVDPGAYKAKLKLADGTVIMLDSAASGILSSQGHTNVVNEEGRLVYQPSAGSDQEALMYNTLITSIGESFPVTLSDGTKVWLNANSSITYPVSFPGNERQVTINGEAYFEVSHNAAKPFIVSVESFGGNAKGKITVLGTHFLVKAYGDEEGISTTLAQGSVAFEKGNNKVVLKPGQKAQSTGEAIKVLNDVNVEKEIAWVIGDFHFAGDNVRQVMRQLTRWYGVEVAFEGREPANTFSGMISRNNKLTTVLKLLEESKVHFRIEGKKITVLSE